jgi:hypothetical protein
LSVYEQGSPSGKAPMKDEEYSFADTSRNFEFT